MASGVLPITGATAIMAYITTTIAVTWVTYAHILRADLDLLGAEGQVELWKEGLMPAIALFFLTWILTYTFTHF